MTEFHVEVVRIGELRKHDNADSLSITTIHGGYPVIVRTGEFAPGDLAVYVPVDAVVPRTTEATCGAVDERWRFLTDCTSCKGTGKDQFVRAVADMAEMPIDPPACPKCNGTGSGGPYRIRAKRLRGVFSMGMLSKADPSWVLGQDVAALLDITKYEPPAPAEGSESDAPDPGILPVYTDIEGLRRFRDLLVEGEDVVVTEKLHGESMRAIHDGLALHVGSRTRWKLRTASTPWWRAAEAMGLEETLAHSPLIGVFGECHGYTGGFPYGMKERQPYLRVFDAMDSKSRTYLNYDAMESFCRLYKLPMVPILYRGPWSWDRLTKLAEGTSELDRSHVREGIVVKPTTERFDPSVGRVILKLHGEGFLTRKGG